MSRSQGLLVRATSESVATDGKLKTRMFSRQQLRVICMLEILSFEFDPVTNPKLNSGAIY